MQRSVANTMAPRRCAQPVVLALAALACAACDAGHQDAGAMPSPDAASADSPPLDFAKRLFVMPQMGACDETAPAPARLRVVTWNMHAALSSSVDAVAGVLAGLDADILLLQEVDAFTYRSGVVDQPRRLAELLGYEYVFAAALPWDGGEFGLAILSRLRFAGIERIWLDGGVTSEQRMGLVATLCRGRQEIQVVNHHADIFPDGATQNMKQLIAVLGDAIGKGLIFGGDLNGEGSSPVVDALVESGLIDVVKPYDPSSTHGGRRLDYVLADAVLMPAAIAGEVVPTTASDHRPVVADFMFE
jgi:endonuclease/exonuclease/phosphatase family metal-dependent hydrolase